MAATITYFDGNYYHTKLIIDVNHNINDIGPVLMEDYIEERQLRKLFATVNTTIAGVALNQDPSFLPDVENSTDISAYFDLVNSKFGVAELNYLWKFGTWYCGLIDDVDTPQWMNEIHKFKPNRG